LPLQGGCVFYNSRTQGGGANASALGCNAPAFQAEKNSIPNFGIHFKATYSRLAIQQKSCGIL
jgi:hypothetical protein